MEASSGPPAFVKCTHHDGWHGLDVVALAHRHKAFQRAATLLSPRSSRLVHCHLEGRIASGGMCKRSGC